MNQTTQQPGIRIMQTPAGLLAQGYLPGVQQLDIDIQEDRVIFTGETMNAGFQEELPLKQPIDTEFTITTFVDEQLRMVMPWRIER